MTDDQLISELQAFERGEKLSVFGELSIQFPRAPVSQQAKRARKDALTTDLQLALANINSF